MATKKKTTPRNRELGAIHIAKKQLGLNEDEYRSLLEAWTGKTSAAKLNQTERRQVIEYFRQMGFRRVGGGLTIADDDKPLTKKIKMLWLELHRAGKVEKPSQAALNAYCRRMTKIDNVAWLPPAKANIVIEGLKAWLQRE